MRRRPRTTTQSLKNRSIPENENTSGQESATAAGEETADPTPLSNAAPEIDPLTAMVMEQEAIETRKAELLLKYKKERARRKRGLTTEGRQVVGESDGVDEASVSVREHFHMEKVHSRYTIGPLV